MSSEQTPDKALERLLRQSFRTRTDKAGSGSCLDADTLAAWADGTLAAKDLAAAEAHASSCDRCLTLLAAMERVTPPAAVSKRWWSYGPMVRWLVPLAAAVTVVAVWVAVPREQQPAVTEQIVDAGATGARGASGAIGTPGLPADSSADLSAVAPRGAEAEASPDAKAEAPSAKTGTSGATGAPRAIGATGASSAPVAVGVSGVSAQAPSAKAEAPSAKAGATDTGPASKQIAESAAKPGDRLAVADEQSARRENELAPARERQAQERKDNAANVAGVAGGRASRDSLPAAPPVAPAAPLSETVQTSAATFLLRRAPIQIVSPDPMIRWRATGGFVERSTDGGATWTATPTQLKADLTAGASPSPSVCWLVGSAGTVLLSTDGTQFRVVPFPERIDLAMVRATDARNATVTTSDARTFATVDGGLTWVTKP